MSKRAVDFFSALLGLVLLAPVLLVLMLLIRLESSGAPIYRQRRVGLNGREFYLYKLRSMVTEADRSGGLLTVGADTRITRLGRILRAAKLDELPQLWNVVRGEMSLVGPRPEVATYVNLYTDDQRQVLAVRPGVTDPASFFFFDESAILGRVEDPQRYYIERLMPEKIRINLEYARQASLLTDLAMIFATVGKIFGLRWNVLDWLKISPPRLGQ